VDKSGQFRLVSHHGGNGICSHSKRFLTGAKKKRHDFRQWCH